MGKPELCPNGLAPPAPWESMDTITDLENSILGSLDVVHIFTAWGETWGVYDNELVRQFESATSRGRHVLVTWEPWHAGQGICQADYSLAQIARGVHDDYIRSWACGIRSFSNLVWLRPMHEMNGDWYPWCIGVNGNTPEDYIAAWRHIRGLFDEEQVTNVRWVWCPYMVDIPASNSFEAAYPGDQCVDLLGLDVYNWGTKLNSSDGGDAPGPWEGVRECLSPSYERIIRLAPQPVWLAEVGCAEGGGSKAQWLRDLLEAHDYDRISALIFFDVYKERDWRVRSSSTSMNAVAQSVKDRPPAAEMAVSPPTPFAVRARRMPDVIEVAWTTVADGVDLTSTVTVFIGAEYSYTVDVGAASYYILPNPKEKSLYSFSVRAVGIFGSSAMSRPSEPIRSS